MGNAPLRFFLGANSRYGFYSLYEGFTRPEQGDFLWLIKGGPGCGKSSFMKRVGAAAEAEGQPVEYIHCSGDPDSLDGVWLPALGTGYMDATAPHAMDAAYPATSSMYLDLGRFYDTAALRPLNREIMELNRHYKALYTCAYAQISAAAEIMPRHIPGLWGEEEKAKMRKKLSAFAAREFKGAQGGTGRVSHRFLDAVSCKGRLFLWDSVTGQCSKICLLDNELGMADFYLRTLAETAAGEGLDVILCHDCLDPKLISALLIPGADLALVASRPGLECPVEVYRHIRLDAMADRRTVSAHRPLIRKNAKLSRTLLDAAMETLAEAKALHDELEAIYNPHVDFGGVYSEAEKHISTLLGG